MDEPSAIVVAALIGGVFSIAAAFVARGSAARVERNRDVIERVIAVTLASLLIYSVLLLTVVFYFWITELQAISLGLAFLVGLGFWGFSDVVLKRQSDR